MMDTACGQEDDDHNKDKEREEVDEEEAEEEEEEEIIYEPQYGPRIDVRRWKRIPTEHVCVLNTNA